MDKFKEGKWNIADSFDLDKASELLDTGVAKNIAEEIRKELGSKAL